MKINNKGYASTIIMFSILTLFLISMLMLVKIMNNSSSLNKKITEKVVDNINYDASGTVQDQILELKATINGMQNQIDNIKGEVINEIYPVGSIYMSTEDDTVEKVQDKFGGKWEKYSQGRTLIGEGTGTDSNGLIQTFTNGSMGGEYTHKLTIAEMPSHNHNDGTSTSVAFAPPFGNSTAQVFYDATQGRPTTSTGGDGSHNNIEPYIVTYMYRRIR